jgi:acetyl-CoA acetyltransferase
VSGLFQGATAVRRALADAGLTWNDVQFATGGSQDAGNADTMVNVLGLTGLPFFNIANGCATGGSSLSIACSMISAGTYDIGVVVGFDKHKRGAFDPNPADWGLGDWYGDTGLMLTTQFFAMKIQRYLYDHAISPGILSKVAAKAYRNGALNPNAWRQHP